ncbi:hypothetical protein PV328_001223 [Microctonus aethiopoides]|uniref:Uncharacterized protein n=1 Tax=Microctonus aethiopoides TaxID=144406 RepID=A0AA39KX92_9HYME|nr:hypothetical protein PV328_001223 [Microctonus aethiopoides]
MFFEKSSHVQLHADDYDEDHGDNNNEDHADNATSEIGSNDINVTISIYTNYHEHFNGHLQFHTTFKKNNFGHSSAVCDRLWWENYQVGAELAIDDISEHVPTEDNLTAKQ